MIFDLLLALQHYSELPDIKRVIVNTHAIEPQVCFCLLILKSKLQRISTFIYLHAYIPSLWSSSLVPFQRSGH
jgi:hypothetical protein